MDQWAAEDASQWRFQFRRIYRLPPYDPRETALSDWEIRYEVQRWIIAEQIAAGERSPTPSAAWLADTAAKLAAIPPEDLTAPTVPVSAVDLFGEEALADAEP